jgi:1-acyl-sn-glycerol-3-phosphate acyltransferase
MTDNLAATARQLNHFLLCITPEGTRSANPEWKKGFYYIAQKAEIPILLFGVDYEKKLIRCSKTVIPNGDIDAQIREIKLYFKDFKGKKPENFALGEV